MKPINAILVLLAVSFAVFAGCTNDQAVPPTDSAEGQSGHELVKRAEPVSRELDQLDRISSAPDGGVGHWTEGNVVELPAGSVDGLADAIAAAGAGGIVRVKSGLHTESDRVLITQAVRIVGEVGAVMEMASDPYTAYPATLDPALHVQDVAGRVVIWGLEIVSAADIGGVAVLLENSPATVVANNEITGYQVGIYTHHADNARIYGNVIETSGAWQTGEIPEAFGIVIANGDDVGMKANDVSSAVFGVWQCDGGAVYKKNNTHDNVIGFILCKVPSAALFLPDGGDAGSENSGHDCLVMGNNSTNNAANGYLVIDGAYNNVLLENRASTNGTYDFELAGDSYRFGFLTPACFDNVAILGHGQVVKDCGNENTVFGGILVDNDLDPCY
jgi:hypothetical protein